MIVRVLDEFHFSLSRCIDFWNASYWLTGQKGDFKLITTLEKETPEHELKNLITI
jgi:uncharacterized protein YlaN (UPF0358 family)